MFNIPLRTSTEIPTPKERRKPERTEEEGLQLKRHRKEPTKTSALYSLPFKQAPTFHLTVFVSIDYLHPGHIVKAYLDVCVRSKEPLT
jgi:hypothetical protein